jgi:hypothetical protein
VYVLHVLYHIREIPDMEKCFYGIIITVWSKGRS